MLVEWLLWHRAAQCVPGVGTAGESAAHREVVTGRKWFKADIWVDTWVDGREADNRKQGWGDGTCSEPALRVNPRG